MMPSFIRSCKISLGSKSRKMIRGRGTLLPLLRAAMEMKLGRSGSLIRVRLELGSLRGSWSKERGGMGGYWLVELRYAYSRTRRPQLNVRRSKLPQKVDGMKFHHFQYPVHRTAPNRPSTLANFQVELLSYLAELLPDPQPPCQHLPTLHPRTYLHYQ